jgi:hypothetical protein
VILTSDKNYDIVFVSRTIKQYGLDPRPTPDFVTTTRHDTTAFRRVVETYKWGVVMFLNNKGSGASSTVIAIGDFDANEGVLYDDDGNATEKLDIPWYPSLVAEATPLNIQYFGAEPEEDDDPDDDEYLDDAEFVIDVDDDDNLDDPLGEIPLPGTESNTDSVQVPIPLAPYLGAEITTTTERPPCVGWHDDCFVCDGGYVPETGAIDPMCAWRDRCIALQVHCRENGRTVEEVLEGRPETEIDIMCSGFLKRYGPFELPASQKATVADVESVVPPAVEKEIVRRSGAEIMPGAESGSMEAGDGTLDLPTVDDLRRIFPKHPNGGKSLMATREIAEEFWDKFLLGVGGQDSTFEEASTGEFFITGVANGSGYWNLWRRMPEKDVLFMRLAFKPNNECVFAYMRFSADSAFVIENGGSAFSQTGFPSVVKGIGKTLSVSDFVNSSLDHVDDFNIGLTNEDEDDGEEEVDG